MENSTEEESTYQASITVQLLGASSHRLKVHLVGPARRDEPHREPLDRFSDRRRTVPLIVELAREPLAARTSLHPDHRGLCLHEKLQHGGSSQLDTEHRFSAPITADDVKQSFADVDTVDGKVFFADAHESVLQLGCHLILTKWGRTISLVVAASGRRETVNWMRTKGLSERQAVGVVKMSASSLRYVAAPDRNAELRKKIVALAHRHRRYGSAMVYLKLRQAGEIVNHKRVERLYREARLQSKRRRRKQVPAMDRQPLSLSGIV